MLKKFIAILFTSFCLLGFTLSASAADNFDYEAFKVQAKAKADAGDEAGLLALINEALNAGADVVKLTTAAVSAAPTYATVIVPAMVNFSPTKGSEIVQAAVDAANQPQETNINRNTTQVVQQATIQGGGTTSSNTASESRNTGQ